MGTIHNILAPEHFPRQSGKLSNGGMHTRLYRRLAGNGMVDIVDSLKIRIEKDEDSISIKDIPKKIEQLKGMMNTAASQLDFETAIKLREEISKLKRKLK